MVQLKFVASSPNEILGTINWFPIHPVSMNNTNRLISSDNVGYASILMEQYLNHGALPGKVGKAASTWQWMKTNRWSWGDFRGGLLMPSPRPTWEMCLQTSRAQGARTLETRASYSTVPAMVLRSTALLRGQEKICSRAPRWSQRSWQGRHW